jgi:metal-responsive CopG/Arc/MetJ family transcriptional regulator
MGKSVKVAISLPEELFEAAERERCKRGETRSEFFRRAVRYLLEREDVLDYIRGYTEFPETEEELAESEWLTIESLKKHPWKPE